MVDLYNRRITEHRIRLCKPTPVNKKTFTEKHGWWLLSLLIAILIYIYICEVRMMENEKEFKEILINVPSSELKEAKEFIDQELRNRGDL